MNADALKILLSNTLPLATNAVKADLTEIAAANGYVAGGGAAAFVSGNQTAGVYKLILSPVVFTAAGGSFGPLQYACLYNDTPSSPLKPLIAWWDYGTAITITNGNSFTVSLDQVNGVFTDT